ncbi:MAG: TIGR04222 domain-containing membrane protein [Chitinophagaceae bacterium]
MNVKQHSNLWINIQNFPLDEAGAVMNFSRKLAVLQNWSPGFTKRVTEEYKKFIFLCCIAENGASPSKVVDEAWHLHLTYTTSYWIDFCKNTLGKEIHHHPSKGGRDEDHKHEEWYKETLNLYENIFGMAPPTDIWPRPVLNAAVIDIPASTTRNNIKKWVAALLALPFLFTGFIYGTLSPFHLTGPAFLVFYFLFGVTLIAAYILIQQEREKQVKQIKADSFPVDVTVFQIAKFLHGRHRAIQTAIVDLIRRNLLTVNNDKRMVIFSDHYIASAEEQNPFIEALLKEPNGSTINYEEITVRWYREELFDHPALENLAATINPATRFSVTGILYAALIVMGGLRMIQGLYHQRPVGFLLVEVIVLTVFLGIVIKWLSTKSLLFRKAEALFKERLLQDKGYQDSLVNEFVINGTPSIAGFAEGFLLASVFSAYGPLERRFGTDAAGSSCSGGSSSCGGDGGGGSCGGCGGGD